MAAKREWLFSLFLRILGTVSLLAVFCVAMPYSWMNAVHQWLGMGDLPDRPIVGYLARSTSAFYAFLGGLLWVVSYDLARHRTVICYVGMAIVLLGLALFAVDWLEGMPWFWIAWEGTINVVVGVAVVILGRRLPAGRSP